MWDELGSWVGYSELLYHKTYSGVFIDNEIHNIY